MCGSLVCSVKIFHIFLLGINSTRNTRWPACSPLKILLTNNPLGCIRNSASLKGESLLYLYASRTMCTGVTATVCISER